MIRWLSWKGSVKVQTILMDVRFDGRVKRGKKIRAQEFKGVQDSSKALGVKDRTDLCNSK